MKIGNIYFTANINNDLKEGILEYRDISTAIKKMTINDYGLLCDDDKRFQDTYLKKCGDIGDMLMGVYMSNNKKFWLINQETEFGRATTVLYPSEY